MREQEQRTTTCPECGARAVPIAYGEPTGDTLREAERGEVAIGGCLISEDSPHWQCELGHRFTTEEES
jgi:hypothetical protein